MYISDVRGVENLAYAYVFHSKCLQLRFDSNQWLYLNFIKYNTYVTTRNVTWIIRKIMQFCKKPIIINCT